MNQTGSQEDGSPLGIADRLRLDYEQTTDLLRTLTDVRFKLLALVPTLSGAAIALLDHPGSAVELLALGVLGLTATLGILFYELRNTELADYATRRARHIESALRLPSADDRSPDGGLYSEEPTNELRLFGFASINRDRGLSLVYSAAIAGWSYLVAWGALRAAHLGDARTIGAAIGAAAGICLLAELARLREQSSEKTKPVTAPSAQPTALPTDR